MRNLVNGKARAIGVSDFNTYRLGELLKVVRIVPTVNQAEPTPILQQPELKKYLDSERIHLIAYSRPGRKTST